MEQTTDWRETMKVAREQAEARLADLRGELKALQDREKAVRVEIDEAMVALGQKRAPKKADAPAPKPRKPRKPRPEAPATEAAPEGPPTEEAPKYTAGAEVRCARIRPKRCGWAGARAMLTDGKCPVCECSVVPIPEEA